MEPGKFSLDKSIHEYLLLTNSQKSLTSSDLKELECHLHDTCDLLIQSGLSGEEAFIIAKKRLGSEYLLAKEYAKVNMSLGLNKIWMYLFLGLGIFYLIPRLYLALLSLMYIYSYNHIDAGYLQWGVMIGANLFTILLIVHLLRSKLQISIYLENAIMKYPIRLIFLMLILIGINLIPIIESQNILSFLIIPVYQTGNKLVEFSFSLMAIGMLLGVVLLLFSMGIENFRKISMKNFLENPNMFFLLCLGLIVETLASSTRIFNHINDIYVFLLFGMVYFTGSFLIVRYNKKNVFKSVLLFASVGLFLEIIFGVVADLQRTEIFTPYFVTVLLTGVILGFLYGKNKAKQIIQASI